VTAQPAGAASGPVALAPELQALLDAGFAEDASGERHAIHSAIGAEECRFLARLIDADPSVRRCLEIGCAFGVASLAIATRIASRPAAKHVIIDPYQGSQWHGLGVRALQGAGVGFFRLIEEPSELALPRLLGSAGASFDLVFIDGWHTFDQTMLDLYYADRLVREGGYIVIDDTSMIAVSRAVAYMASYPGYRIAGEVDDPPAGARRRAARWLCRASPRLAAFLPGGLQRARFGSMVALQKTREVARDWDWYSAF
jgi:predicted O-methyltransferase YrrM